MRHVSQLKLRKLLKELKRKKQRGDSDCVGYLKKHLGSKSIIKGLSFHINDITLEKHGWDVKHGDDLFSRVDLSGMTFVNCDFSEVNLSKLNAAGAKFINCKFNYANLAHANLRNTSFENCDFSDALLDCANLNNSTIDSCNLSYTSFSHSVVENTDIKNITDAEGANFSDLGLISKLFFKNCNLTNAILLPDNEKIVFDSHTTHEINKPIIGTLWNFDYPGQAGKQTYRSMKESGCIAMRIRYDFKENQDDVDSEINEIIQQRVNNGAKLNQVAVDIVQKPKIELPSGSLVLNANKYVERKLSYCDAIVIPGGMDFEPELYGQEKNPKTKTNDHFTRSVADFTAVNYAATHGLPLLGICRGAQAISLFYDGETVQHVDGHYAKIQKLKAKQKNMPGMLGRILQDGSMVALSAHHQAMIIKSSLLETVSTVIDSNKNEVIKLAEGKHGAPLLLSQVHPEVYRIAGLKIPLSSNNSDIFDIFIDSASTKIQQKKLQDEFTRSYQDIKSKLKSPQEDTQINDDSVLDIQNRLINALAKQVQRLTDINNIEAKDKAERISIYAHEIRSKKSISSLEKLTHRILVSNAVNQKRTTFWNTHFSFICNLFKTTTHNQLEQEFKKIFK